MKTGKTPKNFGQQGMNFSFAVVQWLAFPAVTAVNRHQSANNRLVPFTPIRFLALTAFGSGIPKILSPPSRATARVLPHSG